MGVDRSVASGIGGPEGLRADLTCRVKYSANFPDRLAYCYCTWRYTCTWKSGGVALPAGRRQVLATPPVRNVQAARAARLPGCPTRFSACPLPCPCPALPCPATVSDQPHLTQPAFFIQPSSPELFPLPSSSLNNPLSYPFWLVSCSSASHSLATFSYFPSSHRSRYRITYFPAVDLELSAGL